LVGGGRDSGSAAVVFCCGGGGGGDGSPTATGWGFCKFGPGENKGGLEVYNSSIIRKIERKWSKKKTSLLG
jgi:hypothetical protein